MDEKKYQRIKERYFRKVMAYPEGKVVHHGDCSLFDAEMGVCDCGLHHDLMPMRSEDIHEIYPEFFTEMSNAGIIRRLIRMYENGELYEADGIEYKRIIEPRRLTDQEIMELFKNHLEKM